jgi:hypothetical protein
MTPGVYLELTCKDEAQARAVWDALWSTLPDGWKRQPNMTAQLAEAIGLQPEDSVTVHAKSEGWHREIAITTIRNGRTIQMLSMIPTERRYEEDMAASEGDAAILGLLEHLQPQLRLAIGSRLELPGVAYAIGEPKPS